MKNVQNLFKCLERSVLLYPRFHENAMAEVEGLLKEGQLNTEELKEVNKFIDVSNKLLNAVNKYRHSGIDEDVERLKMALRAYEPVITDILSSKEFQVA